MTVGDAVTRFLGCMRQLNAFASELRCFFVQLCVAHLNNSQRVRSIPDSIARYWTLQMSDLSSAYPQLPQLAKTALVVSRDLSKSVYLNSVSCCKLPMNFEHETACYRRCCFHCVTVAEQCARFGRLRLLVEVKFFFRFSETPKPIYILALSAQDYPFAFVNWR